MPNQVPEEIKTRRSNVLLELEKKQSISFRETFMHQNVSVLLEEEKGIGGKKYWLGHTGEYVKVALPSGKYKKNMLVRVKIGGFLTDDILLGEPEAEE